jgi:glutamate formiminotransferase
VVYQSQFDDAAKEAMSEEVWKTKYGPRRVRRDPPTLQEAIAAARGLTDDIQAQVEIAASLMEVPIEQVKAELLKSGGQRKDIKTMGVTAGRPGALRTVVVERKISRRPAALRTMK